MSTVYNDPIMLDSTGQDIVTKLDSIASLMGDGVIDDTSTTATDKTWSASKENTVVNGLQSNVIANTKLIKDTVGWSGKNKLPNNAVTVTKTGVTFTVNNDGSVTVNGTATADTFLQIYTASDLTGILTAGKEYIFSGCPVGVTNEIGSMYINGSPNVVSVDGSESKFTYDTSIVRTTISILIKNGKTVSNVTFKPMIRDAYIIDSTYEPYFGSTAFPRSEQAVLGAVNFCENKAVTQTIENATFNVATDGIITVNRSESGGQAQLAINSALTLKAGTYKLCGFPKLGEDGIGQLHLYKDGYVATDTGDGDVFTLANDTTVIVVLRLNNTKLATNLVVKPMITLDTNATYSDYVPYAMTNRELTPQYGSVTVSEGITINSDSGSNVAVIQGKVVYIFLYITNITLSASEDAVIGTVPYLPKGSVGFLDVIDGGTPFNSIANAFVRNNGQIVIKGNSAIASKTQIYIKGTYICR